MVCVTTTRKDGRLGVCCVCAVRTFSLSCVRACARVSVVALKPAEASNGRSNGAGVYPRASEDAAREDACGRLKEKRARAI